MTGLAAVGLALFCVALLGAALSDLASRRIPNWLTAGLAAGAAVFALPQEPADWISRGGAVLLVSGACAAVYARGGLGGGDLKLLAAISLWTPLATLPRFVLALAAAGGLQALATLIHRYAAAGGARLDGRMPYGVSIAAAGLAWAAPAALGCATC